MLLKRRSRTYLTTVDPPLAMKSSLTILVCALLSSTVAAGQSRMDGTFPFQTDTAKQWSIYVPSGYVAGTAHRTMVAFHPLNTSRWNSISWCDTLIVFAEMNDLLLICPDGGADGSLYDAIDTAFTTALLDSVRTWYSVDEMKTYAMGFSVGGRVTYTYGLSNPDVFGGYLPIGAAITNLNEVGPVIANSTGKPFYLVHGSADSPSVRYTPVLNALIANGAITNSILMPGIGHTIDFPNRNAILTTAFQWIDSVNCASLMTAIPDVPEPIGVRVHPTIVASGGTVTVIGAQPHAGDLRIRLFDMSGAVRMDQRIPAGTLTSDLHLSLPQLPAGAYILRMSGAFQMEQRIVVQ